ncbi:MULTISPECIES: hypothetical protein [Acinetobacter]|uniref:hypothetical protein n=1 Tax=Acinetobacter TaxID=469 RepID=UPI001901345B|nr:MULTISPECIES: hypothetical protein [Acinetobacter]MBJ8444379.1 hypothetical protein [Acinetobacter bereziniae]MBJ9373518.1 hypothetical protein [Acinetobacter sp. TGL-Y2]
MMEILTLVIALLSLIVTYIVYYNNSIGDVVVYAQIDQRRQTIINLVIHNIGKGVAKDIQFICPQGIPKQAYGISGLSKPLKLYDSGAFINGLPILFPDEKLVYSWGQYGALKEALNGKPLEVEITFFSRTNFQVIRRKIKNKVVIDPTAFEGVDISESNFEREVKHSLKEIAKSLKYMSL